ncbi:coiled-coil domain-containing protein 177 [Anguilla rostrata]|uniref:coiled-coil domain-containing protein 177 n=1 Tax=Anguilla rostrata TaxID=7938 RepID=UPI0030CD844C
MEERPSSPMLHLDLNNFDTGDAEGSRYVLTSPRSLEACARLGVKPVQLLHKSLANFVEDHRNVSLGEATLLYEVYEKDRRRLVRRCREEREKIIVEGTERGQGSSVKKQAAFETELEQATESQNSEHKKFRKTVLGTSSGTKNTLGHGKTSSESSAGDMTERKSLKPEGTNVSPRELTVTSLGDFRHTPATERKLEKLEREIRKETSVTVPEKDRKIAALMLLKHEDEQARLRQSQRADEQRKEAQRREQLGRLQAERQRRKELERSLRRWQAGQEARRRQREREEALRAELREREAAVQEERWRRHAEEQCAQRRERQEAAMREAQERKHCQERLLREREREERESLERESRVAVEKELRASRSRLVQERREWKRVHQGNQRQQLRHLLLKQVVNDQALAEELAKRSAMEQKLRRSHDNREQAAAAQQQELKERSMREEEQLQEARVRASWQERQEQRQKEALSQLSEQRQDRAAKLVEEQRQEKARQARRANQERERSHLLHMERVRQEEEGLLLQRQSGIARKESRRERLRREKEEALEEARKVARASFQMREKVREHTQSRAFHHMDLEAQLCASLDRVRL